jgi:hypothetical protein
MQRKRGLAGSALLAKDRNGFSLPVCLIASNSGLRLAVLLAL